jgi:hypothetical protein
LTFGGSSLASAQSENWISQFGTPTGDSGTVVAGDGLGGAFVAMNSGAPIFGPTSFILARHDGAGQQTWIQTLGTPGRDDVLGAAADGAGGLLVGGSTTGSLGGPLVGSSDAWIGRFDANGNEVWLTQLGSAGFDVCWAVVGDGTGGAFACGSTDGALAGTAGFFADAWLAHFSAAGALTWIRQLDSGSSEAATGLAMDGAGGAYVCGHTTYELFGFTSGSSDAWLARYDSAGGLLWGLQWGSIEAENFPVVALNGASGVFVAGSTSGVLGLFSAGETDVWVTAVSHAGTQGWIEQFGTPESDSCAGIESDLAGGFYLTGSTSGVLGASSAGVLDAWIARYDGSGLRSWLRQFGTAGVDRSSGVAVDQPGQFFLSGSTTRDLAAVNAGDEDAWVANFDSLLSSGYCASPANSTGMPAVITATGSSAIALGRLNLRCESLPRFAFGFFILSQMQGFAANPGGSSGNLCVSGLVGRFVGPGQVQNSGALGAISIDVDPLILPHPLGPVAAQAGETWNFQGWFRDANPQVTSNLSNGVAVTFY